MVIWLVILLIFMTAAMMYWHGRYTIAAKLIQELRNIMDELIDGDEDIYNNIKGRGNDNE